MDRNSQEGGPNLDMPNTVLAAIIFTTGTVYFVFGIFDQAVRGIISAAFICTMLTATYFYKDLFRYKKVRYVFVALIFFHIMFVIFRPIAIDADPVRMFALIAIVDGLVIASVLTAVTKGLDDS